MKKIIVFVSVLTVIVSVFSACSKTQTEKEYVGTAATTADTSKNVSDNITANHFEQEVGSIQTSEKVGDEDSYHIFYYDENGYDAKVEHFENGKMIYYYTVVVADENGNGLQLNYYTPSGTFVAMQKNGEPTFYDSAGNVMSETEFENKLGL